MLLLFNVVGVSGLFCCVCCRFNIMEIEGVCCQVVVGNIHTAGARQAGHFGFKGREA